MAFFIPAILVKSLEDFFAKVDIMKKVHLNIGHLDVMDGVAVPNECWGDIQVIRDCDINFEVHLMTKNSLEDAKEWAKLENVVRAIVRYEEIDDLEEYFKLVEKNPKIGLAIDPSSDFSPVLNQIERNNFLLIMGVESGFSRQKFNPKIIERIKDARFKHPDLQIGVDGGMNSNTIPSVKRFWVDVINASSYFWEGGCYLRKIRFIEKH